MAGHIILSQHCLPAAAQHCGRAGFMQHDIQYCSLCYVHWMKQTCKQKHLKNLSKTILPIELYDEPCCQEASLLHNCLADLALTAVIPRNGRGVLETGRPE